MGGTRHCANQPAIAAPTIDVSGRLAFRRGRDPEAAGPMALGRSVDDVPIELGAVSLDPYVV
jgi:hypothetical protein